MFWITNALTQLRHIAQHQDDSYQSAKTNHHPQHKHAQHQSTHSFIFLRFYPFEQL